MKKIIKIILILLVVALIGAGIYVAVKLNEDFSDENTYARDGYTKSYTDEGMYFIKNYNTLYYYDNSTQKETAICDKPNCRHDSETCNAYFPGIIYYIMYYNDRVYVVSQDVYDETDSEMKLISVDKAGKDRRTIYNSDTGVAISMQAVGDAIYFTAYESIDNGRESFEDDYTSDLESYLYVYDLRWNRLKCLRTFEDNEEIENLVVYLAGAGSMDKNNLYLQYSYNYTDGSGVRSYLLRYDIETGDMEELRNFEGYDPEIYTAGDRRFIIYYESLEDGTDLRTVVECDENFQDIREVISVENSRIQYYDGYMHILNSDYNKVLYDYAEDCFYVADTAFTQTGTYISDIYNIIKDENIVYIDATDYTGYMPGDMLPGDISENTSVAWDAFLAEYFIPYEDLSDAQKSELTWLTVY